MSFAFARERADDLADSVLAAIGVGNIGVTRKLELVVEALRAAGAVPVLLPSDRELDGAVIQAVIDESGALLTSDEPGGLKAEVLFVVARTSAGDESVSRTALEAHFIALGYRKHPAITKFFGFEGLGLDRPEIWSVFERRPTSSKDEDDRLGIERDLHADMLREAGVRSDAHVVRYEYAARLIRPNDVVIDAACGLGYGAHTLACLSDASRVIGVDNSDWAIRYATRFYGTSRVEFRCGVLPEALRQFDDETIDCVISLETLEHVEDPRALLKEFYRVLKPGGRIFVSVPNDWADESGRDPNPHHLHVYDWARLQGELEHHFLVECAWRLIASGCKAGEPRVWRAGPRLLQRVPLAKAKGFDAEWWLASAMKSPLVKSSSYRQTVHGEFLGRTHLVDFDRYYTNSWLVHSLVEIPWRLKDDNALRSLALEVKLGARSGTPESGASLAVRGWRLFEAALADELKDLEQQFNAWLAEWRDYSAACGMDNPHSRRWSVSLAYLAGRLHELVGDAHGARHCYQQVLLVDVRSITPTLATKSVDAALRLGVLFWVENSISSARAAWKSGLDAASACLHEDWIEFVGNDDRPFPFSLNDALETMDAGVRCALALRATSFDWNRHKVGRELAELRNRSLRSAVSKLQGKLSTASEEVQRLAAALDEAQRIAGQRSSDLGQLSPKLASTQLALEAAQALAVGRHEELRQLGGRLDQTQAALEQTQQLAVERLRELERVQDSRMQLEGRLRQAVEAEGRLQLALEAAQALAVGRHEELRQLGGRLDQTQAALEQTQQLAVERFAEIQQLAEMRDRLRFSLEESIRLAAWRAAELDRRAAAFGAKQAELEQLHRLVAERDQEIMSLQSQNRALQARSADAARMLGSLSAVSRELTEARASLTATELELARIHQENAGLASALSSAFETLKSETEKNLRLTNSFYWRLGRPLRWIADRFARSLRRR